ncbi:hypothetical protein [Flavobacterium degerlachei]|jgi:hypothetical protein|uniref:HEAT repeat-containing protein n=1 Tax=Flavobacterium degerlachei TaxID=229203 RepID=A0A1H2T1P9_9FLAO|nr:hypothetical protein [Flavobacterium degerlachei]SDW37174.1 hypothetical protein SAMN05444338_102225 [Flavobacterium degerlachei]
MLILNTLSDLSNLCTNELSVQYGDSALSFLKDLFTNTKNGLYNYYNSTNSTEIFYDVLQYIIIPLLLLIVSIFIYLLITKRYRYQKRSLLRIELDITSDNFLTELIFSNFSKAEIDSKIEEYKKTAIFKKKWFKKIILNKIISIKQNINEVDPNFLLKIYKSFGFDRYSKKLILSRNWKNKLVGLNHYQILGYKIKTGYIRPYLNKPKNKYLNSNALIAMIVLSDEHFELIANYKRKISKADELKILNIIYSKKANLPKNISTWLYSENSAIVTLAIKLMVRYRKALTLDEIKQLMNYDSIKVKNETLLAIRLLFIFEANDYLIEYYETIENIETKISCLKTFAVIGDDSSKKFLTKFLEQDHIDVKFQLIKTINKLDCHYFETYKTNNGTEVSIVEKILLHVNNPYIN